MRHAVNDPGKKAVNKDKDKTSPRGMAADMAHASNSTMKSKQSAEREETFDTSSRNAGTPKNQHLK
jgi:hypothetical protein